MSTTDPKTPPTGESDSGAPQGLMDVPEEKGKTVLGQVEEAAKMDWSNLRKVGPGMLVLAGCVIAAMTVPELEYAKPLKPGDPVPFWNVLGRYDEDPTETAGRERAEKADAMADSVLAQAEGPRGERSKKKKPKTKKKPPAAGTNDAPPARPTYVPHPDDELELEQPMELFTGHELDRFFASLEATDIGEDDAITRAIHYGDSAIGVDGIPSAIRSRLQDRFGDAGHGFHLLEAPNTSYRHDEVKFRTNESWTNCFIIHKCKNDGRYGLAGTTAESNGGAESWFAPDEKRSAGLVSRFELWYLAQPHGGNIRLQVDDGEKINVDTKAEVEADAWHEIELPEEGMHELSVRAAGGGRVRAYGVVMEREGPGVVWDGMSQVGAFTKRMTGFDPEHLAAQLGHRAPALVVFMFGGNDMIRKVSMETYADEYREVVRLFKTARPDMDCLIMSPLDHGDRDGQQIISKPIVPQMVEAQRAVAKSEGCAFFDTYTAMGGEGSAGRWYRRSPRLMSGDLGHVTNKGQIVVGELFYRALVHAYRDYRQRQPNSPK